MSDSQIGLAKRFRDLHEVPGMFLMPDAWSPKSARMLEAAGFPAIGTTRSGIAQSLGVVERQGCITRRQTVDAIAGIGSGIDVPLSVDFESGFGATPAMGKVIADRIPQALLRVIKGASHISAVEKEADFNDFLSIHLSAILSDT